MYVGIRILVLWKVHKHIYCRLLAFVHYSRLPCKLLRSILNARLNLYCDHQSYNCFSLLCWWILMQYKTPCKYWILPLIWRIKVHCISEAFCFVFVVCCIPHATKRPQQHLYIGLIVVFPPKTLFLPLGILVDGLSRISLQFKIINKTLAFHVTHWLCKHV